MTAAGFLDTIRKKGTRDPRILEAMEKVPRSHFIPVARRAESGVDAAIPIGEGQTISQPSLVAHMIDLLHIGPHDRVLEVGTGSGYAAAVLAHVAGEVHTIERIPALAHPARQRVADLGIENVWVMEGDGSRGWPEHAPYDAILVSAGTADVPPALKDQLADGGRLLVPVGERGRQRLLLIQRAGQEFTESWHTPVAFVPLIAEDAGEEE